MFLTEIIYFCHTGGIIAVSEPVYQSIGSIIITDGDHGRNIAVYFFAVMGLGNCSIIFVDSTHDIKFDQTGSLHWSVIDRSIGIFQQVADIYGPGSVICWE